MTKIHVFSKLWFVYNFASCLFTFIKSISFSGKEERVCEEGGWSGDPPKCVYTKCPDLATVENADVTIIGDKPNYLGSKVIYTCKEGHKATGSLSRECLEGGRWSGSTPKCEFVDCGNAPSVTNARSTLLDSRTTFGASVEYKCDKDYIPVGDTIKKCEAEGHWSRSILTCDIIECPEPKAPSGGRVHTYPITPLATRKINREIHSQIEYSCLPGHVLEGDSIVTCTDTGSWSSRAPSCRYVDCGRVPKLPERSSDVRYLNGSTHLNSVIQYTCGRSHSILGNEMRTCLSNGKWSGQTPSCSEIRCTLPPKPNNTIVSVSSTERLHGTSVIRSKFSEDVAYRVGSTLKYRCERGHILYTPGSTREERVVTRRCTTSGEWTGDTPVCRFVDCGPPEIVQNAEYELQITNATFYGSVVTYSCNDHFKLEGKPKTKKDNYFSC